MAPRCVRTVAAALVVGFACSACRAGNGGSERRDGSYDVVAAFYPIAEAVSQVGGDRVTVHNLTPAGAEPHDLELTPDDVDAIEDARSVFVLGHGFQPALEDSAEQRNDHTVSLLDELSTETDDPHVWLDPVLYARIVDAVERELAAIDPRHAATYEQNAERYKRVIASVGARYQAGLAHCDRRTIVTAHEAFGHLARRYHLDQEGIAGVAPDQEPSAKRMAELADLVDREGVTTIFTEELVSPRVADALAREAGGVRTAVLNPLEGLRDEEVRAGDSWVSVMDSNLAKLRHALGCR
jgi:zinc transport system substrate-binding protein